MAIKTIKGLPTKKALFELSEKHGIRPMFGLKDYGQYKTVIFGRDHENERAELMAAELRAEGFIVELRPYKSPTTGQVKINEKVK